MIPALSATRLVVAVEEEGHGRTRPTDRPLSSEASAEDIRYVLDDVGLCSVDVLAFSAGCQTVLALAMAHPDRLRRIIVCSAPWRRDVMVEGFWDSPPRELDDAPRAPSENPNETLVRPPAHHRATRGSMPNPA